MGLSLLICGAAISAPLIALLKINFEMPGASAGVLIIGVGLVAPHNLCLRRLGCHPAASHHLGRPLLASAFMAPVCLVVVRVHVLAAVAAPTVTYLVVLRAIGGLDFRFQSAGTGDPHSALTRQQTASRTASKRRAEIEEESESLG